MGWKTSSLLELALTSSLFCLDVSDFFLKNYSPSLLIFSAFLIDSFSFYLFFLLISSIFFFQFSSSICISFSIFYWCFSLFRLLFSIFFLISKSIYLVLFISFSLIWFKLSCIFCLLVISPANFAIYSAYERSYMRRASWISGRLPVFRIQSALRWTFCLFFWEMWRWYSDPFT